MKHVLIVALMSFSALAHAQYKCTVNGKSVYSDEPCARDARDVSAAQDRVTREQQIQRLELSIKERQERDRIERREAVEEAIRKDEARRKAEVAAANRKRRCGELRHELKWNERSVARYQDFGWQRSLAQQEAESKRNREAYDRECR